MFLCFGSGFNKMFFRLTVVAYLNNFSIFSLDDSEVHRNKYLAFFWQYLINCVLCIIFFKLFIKIMLYDVNYDRSTQNNTKYIFITLPVHPMERFLCIISERKHFEAGGRSLGAEGLQNHITWIVFYISDLYCINSHKIGLPAASTEHLHFHLSPSIFMLMIVSHC